MRTSAFLTCTWTSLRALSITLLALSLIACAALGASDYKLGMAYHHHGLYRYARASFAEGAHAGSAEAKNMLGWYWANGLGGLPKNVIQACDWYAEAARKGLADAINNLGACYEYPGFVQQDMTRAIELYTLAARKGNSNAQQNLARLGRPVPAPDLAPRKQPAVEALSRQQAAEEQSETEYERYMQCIRRLPPAKTADEGAAVSNRCKQEAFSVRETPPRPVPAAPPQPPVARDEPQQSDREESSSGGAWLALATAVLNAFAASKGYGTAPPPMFVPPRAISVHCTTLVNGQTAFTNCN
jgi:Sel1 repeat